MSANSCSWRTGRKASFSHGGRGGKSTRLPCYTWGRSSSLSIPLYLQPCRRCWVRLSFLQRLRASTDTSYHSRHRHQTVGFCWIGPVDAQRALYAASAMLHLAPAPCRKCVNMVEMGRELPNSSLMRISFYGNAKHDKGWQSKTIKYSLLAPEARQPNLWLQDKNGRSRSVNKRAFSVQVFRFSKQLLARGVSLLFNCCKLGGFGHYSTQFCCTAPQVSLKAKIV